MVFKRSAPGPSKQPAMACFTVPQTFRRQCAHLRLNEYELVLHDLLQDAHVVPLGDDLVHVPVCACVCERVCVCVHVC